MQLEMGRKMNGLCLWQDSQMATRLTERHKASPIIREMQTTMRCHLTAVRMAKINSTRNNRCWWGYAEEGALLHSWCACEQVQPLWKTVWRVLEKLKKLDPWVVQWFGTCLWPRVRIWRPGIESHFGLQGMEPASPSACVSASLSVTIIKKFF